tara:strand:- start:4285 stop:4686 length:402 start_codon:yes stop_codon:yes gene_type:complete
MNTRTLTGSDYEILSDWWKAWGWPVMAKDMLPDNGTGGIMVENKGENIVAGFLYWSNSKLVWLDWIISNPNADKKIRKQAIEMLILTAEQMVKDAGSKYMMSISRSNSLLKIHEKIGWSIDKTPSHEMIKVII